MPDLSIVKTEPKRVSIWELHQNGILAKIFGQVQSELTTIGLEEMERELARFNKPAPAGENIVSFTSAADKKEGDPITRWIALRTAAPSSIDDLLQQYIAGQSADDECMAGFDVENLSKFRTVINQVLEKEGYSLKVW